MQDYMITDQVTKAAKIALDGLSARQQVISRNVANVDTPGYRAQTVSFENAVQQAMESQNGKLKLARTTNAHLGDTGDASPIFTTEYRPGGSYRADQNNVDLDVELTDMNENSSRYDTVVQLLAKRYRLVKEIIVSR